MAAEKTTYLTPKELTGCLPKGKTKVKRLENLDRRYECYFFGEEAPSLDEELKKSGRPIYWYDYALDLVRLFDAEKDDWKIAPKDTPKLVVKDGEDVVIGIVDEDNILASREASDLLNAEI